MKLGKLISFEGIDGSGKTTQIRLISHWLKENGYKNIVTYQPGGSRVGQQIRKILLDKKNVHLNKETELLLYLADRIQNINENIIPSIKKGHIVLCDRFHESTIAYQGYGRKMDLNFIKSIEEKSINPFSPDLIFLLNIDPKLALKRIKIKSGIKNSNIHINKDRLETESIEFFERVAKGYLDISKKNPIKFIILNANDEKLILHKKIQKIIKKQILC